MKSANPDAVILAEHYGDPASWLQGNEWDTIMNYDAFMEPVTWFLTGMEKHSDADNPGLFGDGGMPSGHSATVTSLAACVGLVKGLDSVEFAIAGIVAVVVCHDARGVRLETGKQSTILNEMQKTLKLLTSQELTEVKLKEFVGHTPTQVAAGIIMGIVNAIIVYNLFM